VIVGPGQPVVTVALTEPVDPANAPYPANDSERLLFRQLYETLVRVDCEGQVRPGLAASWRPDASERTWIVTLRDDARFTDGAPVTTADVLASWTRGGIGGDLQPLVSGYVESAVAAGDRALAITLRAARDDAPLVLAHIDLAIAKRSPGSPWPLGTRAARMAQDRATADASGRTVITLTGIATGSTAPDAGAAPWSVRILVHPGRDARDFLDEGVDLLVTRDPAALDYAATLPQFLSVPLEWQRTHVFVSRRREPSLPPLTAEARQALAGDAIRGEARGAAGPFWWTARPDCGIVPAETRGELPPATGRVVFPQEDGAARDLAERVVGLARVRSPAATAILDALLSGPPGQTFQQAVGLTGQALALAQARGVDAGYVLALDRRPLDPCQELRALVDRLGWLDPDTIVPLVDTRLRVIARRGRSGVTAEWDGGLLITGVGGGR
jgi:hypothetical protein